MMMWPARSSSSRRNVSASIRRSRSGAPDAAKADSHCGRRVLATDETTPRSSTSPSPAQARTSRSAACSCSSSTRARSTKRRPGSVSRTVRAPRSNSGQPTSSSSSRSCVLSGGCVMYSRRAAALMLPSSATVTR